MEALFQTRLALRKKRKGKPLPHNVPEELRAKLRVVADRREHYNWAKSLAKEYLIEAWDCHELLQMELQLDFSFFCCYKTRVHMGNPWLLCNSISIWSRRIH